MLAVVLPVGIAGASGNDAIPFPYNASYPYGLSSLTDNPAAANSLLLSEWEHWKSAHITSSGARGFKRVQRDPSTNYDTVSEGLGYGMLLAVYFGEQQLFNDLYGYVKCYFNSNGLMGWRIDANGNIVGENGKDAATDADEDIAVSLVFAHKKWGSAGAVNYQSEAKTYINNLYRYTVEPGTYILKTGDTWGGTSCVNPSYFSPAWYRIFADFTGNSSWINVADKCYEIVNNIKKYNNNTGLVPDWCTASGTPSSGMDYDYKYDAIRYQLRTAIDYSWYGTAQAKINCDTVNTFFRNIGAANIKDGYTITGNQISSNHNASFVSCAAGSAMTGTKSSYTTEIYNENVKIKDSGNYTYFGNTLRMICLLYTTGNLPNLYNYNPDPNPGVKGDVNKDSQVNSVDFALVKRYILGYEDGIDLSAADMNSDGIVNSSDLVLLKMVLLN
nr:glycosyl hydrolase family 8 [Anaerobacterium chartisolvens]